MSILTKVPQKRNQRRRKELIFYSLMMVIPVIQVIIFYFVVNFNSILLSLKDFTYGGNGIEAGYHFVGFDNFIKCFRDLFNEFSLQSSLKNSLLAFSMQTLIMPWVAMIFSYYIYKNRFGSKLFNVFLFLPSIISPLVITMIYKVMLEDALPQIMLKLFSMKVMPIYTEHTIPSLLFYYLFTGFGTSVLLYTGAMSGIDPSVMEAADLDGATGIKGFVLIVFPLVYPTFVTFITVGFASIFTNQLNLFSFANAQAEKKYYTFGYFLYRQTAVGGITEYPYLSAMGLIFTFIAIPLTFGARWLLNKIGPSQD
ncbi:MAG: sugar ABC transporter permease [Clostridia bacterium]|nr:sugar ABC transporter permease [Clostridia bacterium]